MNEPKLLQVPTDHCAPAPWANRTDLNLTPEFLADIKNRGVRQSLEVRPLDGKKDRYEIIAGVRRWSAAVKGKVETVPVLVVSVSDQEGREGRLIENLHREGLTALDEAEQYQEALKTGDYGTGSQAVEKLAAKVGKSRSAVYARLRLLKLNPAVHKAVAAGELEQTVAELVSTIPDVKGQEAALKKITEHQEWDHASGERVKTSMSFRDAKELIEEEFRKPLKDAPFDLKADKLAGEMSCVACPMRTGNIAGLPAGSGPDVCTAPACYARKVAAHQENLLAKIKAQGKTVLTGKDAPKFQYGGLAYTSGYVEANGTRYHGEKHATYPKLLGKHMPEILHTVNPDGKVVAVCRKKDIEAALVAAKIVKPDPKADPAKAKAEREKEEREEAIREVEVTRIVDACMKVVENPKISDRMHALLWAFVFRQMFTSKDEGAIERMRLRHNEARESLERTASIRPDADMVLESVRGAAIESILLADYEADYNEEQLNDLCKLCKVDTAAIAKAVRAEFAEREKKAAKADAAHPVTKMRKAIAKSKAKK